MLHPHQMYVIHTAHESGIQLIFREHPYATITCKEKAELLGWEEKRIVKALYVSARERYIGIITPETGKPVDIVSLLIQIGKSKKEAKHYTFHGCPEGMIRGTCTPFPYAPLIGKTIEQIIILKVPSLEDTLVDISLGGDGEEAQKRSLHLPYNAIYHILVHSFPNYTEQISLEQDF